MTKRLTATAGALLALVLALAAPSTAGAATPVNGKWRGVVTHWADDNLKWHAYSGAQARRRSLSFSVVGGKSKRILLFSGKAVLWRCPKEGNALIKVQPNVIGVVDEVVKVSRSGSFNKRVWHLVSHPAFPDGEATVYTWITGKFTSTRTVRADLIMIVVGCGYTFEAWSASNPKPKPKPKHKPKKTPTPGVDDGGSFYGCHLIWCGFELPPPFVPSLS